MSHVSLPDDLAVHGARGGTIIMLVMDGLGGLPHPDTGRTELESAATPNLDALAERSSLGMLAPVGQGITPGSGPGHLALFGYDPIESMIGRGVLSALGVGFELQPGDVAARLNIATIDLDGVVTDRRAGRPSDEDGRRVIELARDGVRTPAGIELTLVHEKEHRAVLVLRGEDLGAGIVDTDPQRTGLRAISAAATGADPASERTARIVQDVLDQVREVLADEPRANAFLARGFAGFTPYPSFETRYGLRAVAVAKYPMYRGVASLVGMTVDGVPDSNESTVEMVERHFGDYDFYFIHFKDMDSRAHDGDFEGKVAAIEEVDALLPRITELEADALIVTGDHSSPATYGEHTWHHVPTLIASNWARPSAGAFGESSCRGGDLGVVPGKDLMSLALAHAARLDKYGA
jgi:2,3-bisphosphoglycerate-independent phosphoglycerate mutase